jgi:hypothetical protein
MHPRLQDPHGEPSGSGPRWFGAKGFDTLTQALRSGALETVPAALMLYGNPGGATEARLRWRRKAEGGPSGVSLPIGGHPVG